MMVKSHRVVPKNREDAVFSVKPEAAVRPRGAYFYSPEVQEWKKIKEEIQTFSNYDSITIKFFQR